VREPLFDLTQLRGKLVVVYFWASTSEQVGEDFATLKRLTDRYRSRGLELVYVNLDDNPTSAEDFLSEQLTAGTHLFARGGLDGPIAESYDLHSLPQAFAVAPDGTLLRHSVQVAELEALVSAHLGASRETAPTPARRASVGPH
jgi:hypothetical protein